MFLFSATHASKFDETEPLELPGEASDANNSQDTESRWRVHRSTQGDRTQWGYYLELAPPVLPHDASDALVVDTLGEQGQREEHTGPTRATRAGQPARGIRRRTSHAPSLFAFLRLSAPVSLIFPTRRTASTQSADPDAYLLDDVSHDMAVKTHTWVSLWFLLTAPVIFWDAFYCFMRPRSMVGGDLHWIWKPYEIYQEVDYVYGVKALNENNGFTNAQSFLNIIETLLNLAYLYQAHITGSPGAPLTGFASAVMTLSKTVLYWAQEYYCGGCAVGHNKGLDLLVYWIIPNGLWLLVPSLIVWRLSKDISASLNVASKKSKTQ